MADTVGSCASVGSLPPKPKPVKSQNLHPQREPPFNYFKAFGSHYTVLKTSAELQRENPKLLGDLLAAGTTADRLHPPSLTIWPGTLAEADHADDVKP
jgi:hypothetical protein